ncbi:pirin family protein [Aquirhabdus parva]|uniref:Pirin family protein n=1 Tax=Aquirhabdus parva TaxID=2283318 RepID=A0A345P426_9GAMM|nr:pirin family protein [Aquirhabdus parva]AXI02035.1 pirin family protein [Aquirhabdus parva]
MTSVYPITRIEGRVAEIGTGLKISRMVPSRARRTVGAWCFLDHAGPVNFAAGDGMNVGPHPHIGLQTFTWMIAGQVRHLDSLGNDQVIYPHQVNLMTAGRGISHAEVSPSDTASTLHAAQLWIALPDSHRHIDPDFQNYPELPVVDKQGFKVTVLVGSSLGATSPVQVFSPLLGLDLEASKATTLELPLDQSFEHGLTILEGEATADGEVLTAGTLLFFETGRPSVTIQTTGPARLLLVGGEPFKEDIIVWWNFVGRTHEEIEQALADWNTASSRFGTIDNPEAGTRLIAPALEGHIKGAH